MDFNAGPAPPDPAFLSIWAADNDLQLLEGVKFGGGVGWRGRGGDLCAAARQRFTLSLL